MWLCFLFVIGVEVDCRVLHTLIDSDIYTVSQFLLGFFFYMFFGFILNVNVNQTVYE